MLTLEILKDFGANVDAGLERCMGDEDFYLELIPDALDEAYYKNIEEAIASKDLDSAFDRVHALKGVLANLSLTPIFEPVNAMTEELRLRQDIDYSPYLKSMWESRNQLLDMMK